MIYKNLTIFFSLLLLLFSSCTKDESMASSNGPELADNAGTGGSLARFTISGNYMYVVDAGKLYTFNITAPQDPRQVSVKEVGFNIETIFPYGDKLFIGSQDAMYIYSISDPANPDRLGVASHLRACDPVVANDSIAYVTVRTGSNCGGNINALNVYNVNDPLNPVLYTSLGLSNPRGLSLNGNALYICDEAAGLRVMNIDDPYNPQQVQLVTGDKFYDCIALQDFMICMIEGGMAIYDTKDKFAIRLMSRITE